MFIVDEDKVAYNLSAVRSIYIDYLFHNDGTVEVVYGLD